MKPGNIEEELILRGCIEIASMILDSRAMEKYFQFHYQTILSIDELTKYLWL